jgi:predicted nucleic acid-binding Zn ribbon protein
MKSLASILPGVLRELKLEDTAAGWRAVSEWPSISGERIARRTHATAFRDGVLTIEVDGSAWMHELGFLERDLVQRVNQHLGAKIVRELRFMRSRGGSPQ